MGEKFESRRRAKLAALEEANLILSGVTQSLEPTPADIPLESFVKPMTGEHLSENLIVTRSYRKIVHYLQDMHLCPFPLRREGLMIPFIEETIIAYLRSNTLILNLISLDRKENTYEEERIAFNRKGEINYYYLVFEKSTKEIKEKHAVTTRYGSAADIKIITNKIRDLEESIKTARDLYLCDEEE